VSEGQPQLLTELSSSTYYDSAVSSGVHYFYSVSAVSSAYMPNESYPTQWVEAVPMPKPIVTGITMIGSNEIRITFDQLLSSAALNPGCYKVDHDIGTPTSVNSVLNQYGIQLRFRNAFPDIEDYFLIKLENVFGLTGVAPAQTLYSFSYNPDFLSPVIEKAIVLADKKSVEITLSETVYQETALLLENYELFVPANDAGNSLQAVMVDDNRITVVLKEKLKYSNKPYSLTIHNIADLAGNNITPNQNTCKFTLSDITGLDKIVVYPNPVNVSMTENVSFLNFPTGKKGKLSIYGSSGDLIYQHNIGPFTQINNNVTCRWDLRNQAGKKVSSGIYFYLINMGSDVKKGKIAVLN